MIDDCLSIYARNLQGISCRQQTRQAKFTRALCVSLGCTCSWLASRQPNDWDFEISNPADQPVSVWTYETPRGRGGRRSAHFHMHCSRSFYDLNCSPECDYSDRATRSHTNESLAPYPGEEGRKFVLWHTCYLESKWLFIWEYGVMLSRSGASTFTMNRCPSWIVQLHDMGTAGMSLIASCV